MTDVFLYLTTIGRTSGLPRRIEIWFVEVAGARYVVAEMRREAGWVKNLLREPRVSFSIGTGKHPESALPARAGRARIVEPTIEPALAESVSAEMTKKYGWSDGLIVEIAADP